MVDLDPVSGQLPPGQHELTLPEAEAKFCDSMKRKDLWRNLMKVLKMLRTRGVTRVWLDGSFVSDKRRPKDIDVVFEPPPNADLATWGEFAPTAENRAILKSTHQIDLWPSGARTHGKDMVTFFSQDRNGEERGLILLSLEELDDQE